MTKKLQKPSTDNECTEMGWAEYLLTFDSGSTYHISAPKGRKIERQGRYSILAFSHDDQEMMGFHLAELKDVYKIV